jgi:hypothetical protein
MATGKNKPRSIVGRGLDLSSPATAEAFKAAAKAYTKKATKTKASAIKTLRGEGILAKNGRLAKRYASGA